jgi:GntR family transcriptional regulator
LEGVVAESRLWEVVYTALRTRIDSGDLGPGDQVPGELDLATEHGVSRATIRQALQRLQQEGVVTEGRGRLGRTVRAHHPLQWNLTRFERGTRRDDQDTGLDDWAAGVAEAGHTPRQIVAVSITPAPATVAKWLEIPTGELAVRRHRRRLVDDTPYQLATSWFPESIARDTPLMEERDVVMPGGILAAIGHPQRLIRDEITVRMPTPTEADELDLPMGTPVGQHVRIGIGHDDRPVRVMITIFPGDRQILAYELVV